MGSDLLNRPREAWWKRVSRRMDKASENFSEQVKDTVLLRATLDEQFYDQLVELLVAADCGVETANKLCSVVREAARADGVDSPEVALTILKSGMLEQLSARNRELNLEEKPTVILVLGVNGSGKTTTVAKLANEFKQSGLKPLVAAADTFRAAAIDQLKVWCDRVGVEMVSHQAGADSAAVAFDAVQAAVARGCDVVLIDTAGRLHTKENLLVELQKMVRALAKIIPGAPHERLLVLDAPTGMNAIAQAKAFADSIGITGLVLTKLDGTSKGGTIFAIEDALGVPTKFVGMGESIDDLGRFDPQSYVDALFAGVG
jgi:fused signal recognition particle receptor